MSRRKIGQEKIRKIQKVRGTYMVSLPIDIVRQLKLRERQRVTVVLNGSKITIEDYK